MLLSQQVNFGCAFAAGRTVGGLEVVRRRMLVQVDVNGAAQRAGAFAVLCGSLCSLCLRGRNQKS